MTPERIAITLTPTDERCHYCDAPIPVASGENELVPVDEYGQPFCNPKCVSDYAEAQNERAYEKQIEEYYGGSTPQTEAERYQAAAEEKRRVG